MKIICLLLSFYVVLLSARPCCADDVCISKSSLKKEQAAPTDDCAGCSPFFSCGTCTGFISVQALNYIASIVSDAPVQRYSHYHQPYLQQVAQAIWQPPKIS